MPPLYQILPYFRNFSESTENFYNLTLFPKNVRFSPAKIYDDPFLIIESKFISIPPYFRSNSTLPLFLENYFFPPDFVTFLSRSAWAWQEWRPDDVDTNWFRPFRPVK